MTYTDELISYLINWFPFLLLICVWIFFMMRTRGGTKYQKECMEVWRQQVNSLERIAAALEKRS